MLNWKSIILLITFSFWMSFPLKADLLFFHYGIEQGLPEVRINSISQDSAGFIWMAGVNDLYRFDGERFTIYRHATSSSAESFFGKINMLYTDSGGILWAGSSNGIFYYDFPGDQFIQIKAGWNNETVYDISEDNSGNLWLATSRGLAKIDPQSVITTWYTDQIIAKSEVDKTVPVNEVHRIACGNDGRIWYSNQNDAVFFFDPNTMQTKKISFINGSGRSTNNITKLQHVNSHLFISTLSNGFYWVNTDNMDWRNQGFPPFGYSIHHFTVSSDSTVWLAGNNGLILFNFKKGTYHRYTEDPGDPLSLTRTAIVYVYQDREKNIWVSSGLRGVDYGLTNSPFRHFPHSDQGAYQISQPEVTAIEFDQENNMWLGYEGGFIEKHSHTPLKKTTFNSPAENKTGSLGAVFTLFCDSKNRMWYGGWKTGLYQLNASETAFNKVNILPDSLAAVLNEADIRDIKEDSEGNLWISFHSIGLGMFNPDAGTMELFRHNPGDTEGSLSNNWTFNMCTDAENNLWIASAHGISKLNLKGRTFENYFKEPDNLKSLNNNYINTIYCDPAGMVWAGTDNGLNVFIASQNTFIPVLNQQNNTSYSISDIQSTKPGEIWASTKSGLIQLTWSWDSLQEGLMVNSQFFNRKSGLLSTSYFERSSASTSDGIIYFGGNEGIDYFEAERASAFQITAPSPVLTELTIDGLPVRIDNATDKNRVLNLNHTHRMLSIRFAAPSFNHPEKLKYRYKMEGFDKQWIYPQYEQTAIYTNLPPGSYTFIVENEDRNGKWIQNAAILPVSVKPPFWKTFTFYAFAAVFLILLISVVVYSRSRIFLLRQKELEKIIDARTKELLYNNSELEKINQTKDKMFSIISHDLRSPFAGVVGLLELLTDQESGIEEERKNELLVMAKNSADNTFELLENLLTWAHSQMKKTVSRPVRQNLSPVLIKNIDLKKTSAQQKEIEILQKFPENLEAVYDRDMINTVVRNLLNNAVKFTHPGGKIEVSAFTENGNVMVNIADSGVGIDPEDAETLFYDGNISRKGTLGEKGTGLGLIICREFVEKNSGKIWASPNQPKGTVFSFILPAD